MFYGVQELKLLEGELSLGIFGSPIKEVDGDSQGFILSFNFLILSFYIGKIY